VSPINATSTEEEHTSIGEKLTTLCGAIIDHVDEGPEVEHFAEVAYYEKRLKRYREVEKFTD